MVSSKSRQQIQLVQAYLKTASDEEIVMWLIQTVKMMQNTRLGTEQKIDQVCRTFDIYVPVVIKRVCLDIIDGVFHIFKADFLMHVRVSINRF